MPHRTSQVRILFGVNILFDCGNLAIETSPPGMQARSILIRLSVFAGVKPWRIHSSNKKNSWLNHSRRKRSPWESAKRMVSNSRLLLGKLRTLWPKIYIILASAIPGAFPLQFGKNLHSGGWRKLFACMCFFWKLLFYVSVYLLPWDQEMARWSSINSVFLRMNAQLIIYFVP